MRQADHADLGSVARPTALYTLVAICAALGSGVLAAVAVRTDPQDLRLLAALPAVWIVLILVLLAEAWPVVFPHRGDAALPASTVFTVAVLLYLGLAAAVMVAAAAAVAAGLIRRHRWWRTCFNLGQGTLSLGAAYGVLVLVDGGLSAARPWVPSGSGLVGAVLAGVAYLAVSRGLVRGALGLWHGDRFAELVGDELSARMVAAVALLGLSPLVAVVLGHQPALVPLFLFPLAAIQQNASVCREQHRQSLHDGLTGLPNRSLLRRRSEAALAEAQLAEAQRPEAQCSGRSTALFLLDLDRFKEVNDTLGHLTGDRLLQLVAARLQATLRPQDTVARLGGDEFGILLPSVPDPATAREIAGRVVYACAEPFHLDGIVLDLEASIGVALYPHHGADFETLLQRADVAMYLAKSSRSGVEMYAVERDRNTPDRLALLGDLRRALDAGEVELHYQPKVALDTGSVTGLEALLRWRHTTRGELPPDEFVTLAEQTGLMPRLTEYVLDAALRQTARWWRFGLRVPVAVNVSLRDIHGPDFVSTVCTALRRYGMPPSALQLEITERMLLSEPQRAAETLTGLDELGVRLSLDDFGTGYSSLVHLRRLPVSEIKIDRSFVARLADDAADAAIVRSAVDLAHSLGLEVVAEGVENEETWKRLDQLGCDAAQGWLMAEALPPDAATDWLRRTTEGQLAGGR